MSAIHKAEKDPLTVAKESKSSLLFVFLIGVISAFQVAIIFLVLI